METVITTIQGSDSNERISVVLSCPFGGSSRIELRQQSWGDGIGWFTQSSVCLEPHQVAELKNAFGSHQTLRREFSKLPQRDDMRVVHAETA